MPEIFDATKHQAASNTMTDTPQSSSNINQRQQNAFDNLVNSVKVSSNPFGSFVAQPRNTSIDIQMDDEEVLLLMRQHPVTQIKWLIVAIVLILVPLLFSAVPILNFLPDRFHTIVIIGWYLMVVGFSLEVFLDWFYNIYIVTNERVIDIDFNSLLFKNVSTARLDRIEDVTVTNKGYLGSVFDYGTVLVQTAGAVDQFEFADTPHPGRVSAFINELLNKEEHEPLDVHVEDQPTP